MNLDVFDLTGKKISSASLPASVFNHPANPILLAQAVRVYLSNQRQGTKHAKTRAEVSYSTRKLWRQKGTGHARHGSRRAPIFVGGGVAHGPTGNEQYTLKLTKKMRQAALYGALTIKAADQSIRLIADATQADGKTKNLLPLLKALTTYPKSNTLFVLDQPYPAFLRAIKNLGKISATQVARLNTYEVLNHQIIIFTQKALAHFKEPEVIPAINPPVKAKTSAKPTSKLSAKGVK